MCMCVHVCACVCMCVCVPHSFLADGLMVNTALHVLRLWGNNMGLACDRLLSVSMREAVCVCVCVCVWVGVGACVRGCA